MGENNVSLDKLIQNRLSAEIGRVTGQLIEAQTYNEILVQQNNELKEELSSFKQDEFGDKEEEVEVIETEEGE